MERVRDHHTGDTCMCHQRYTSESMDAARRRSPVNRVALLAAAPIVHRATVVEMAPLGDAEKAAVEGFLRTSTRPEY